MESAGHELDLFLRRLGLGEPSSGGVVVDDQVLFPKNEQVRIVDLGRVCLQSVLGIEDAGGKPKTQKWKGFAAKQQMSYENL